jgi:hypothetical protein
MAIGTLFTLFILPAIYTVFASDHRPKSVDEELSGETLPHPA